MKPVAVRGAEWLLLGALPVLALAFALRAYAGDDRLALDFHHELYRQAEAVLDGREASTRPTRISRIARTPLADGGGAAVVPLAALPLGSQTGWQRESCSRPCSPRLGSPCPRLARLRRRPALAVGDRGGADGECVAAADIAGCRSWRYRERAALAGLALGYAVALKLFLWPLVVWLALGRRTAAAVAALVAAASPLLLLPWTSLADYVRLLRNLGETFEHDAYTPFALLTDIGVPDTAARIVTVALGLALPALAWRRRSLGLAIAAALVLSPIVWRHFFTLLLVPSRCHAHASTSSG